MPQDNIEEIKSKIDIVDLLQEYIQLKPAGTNNYKALCPFHGEKTPSFMVSRDKQIWHCFGCGEGGDIFAFVQKMEGMEFPEALRVLAKKAGVRLQYQNPELHNQKTRMMDICRSAASFFHHLLVEHPKVQPVREYLKKRNVSEETMEAWLLGYAPDDWEALNTYLRNKGFNEEDVFQAGLTIKKDRGVGYIDRFRNRLIFPIADTHGNIVGFGGRWLGKKEENKAKYINSPQTLIYDKSKILYGIDKAKTAIKKQRQAIIVEGYMDCIASHQAGVTNVVASSGTSLTTQQVQLLKRFTATLLFSFDQDLAGDTAAKRGIEVAWQEEMNTRVIQLPEGKDPDDCIREGVAVWKKAIESSKSVMDYYFDTTCAQADLANVEDKKRVAKELLAVIAKLADAIEQSHYIQRLSEVLTVPEEALRDTLKKIRPSAKSSLGNKKEESGLKKESIDQVRGFSEGLVGLVLFRPEQLNYCIDQLPPEYMPSEKLRRLYKSMIVYYTKKQIFDYNDFKQSLSESDQEELVQYADVLLMRSNQEFQEASESEIRQEIVKLIRGIKRRYIQNQLRDIEQQLKKAESEKDQEAIDSLSQKFSEFVSMLNKNE